MEYRSPLGYSFKLEQSLLTSKENETKETPKKEESHHPQSNVQNNSGPRTPYNYNGGRNSRGNRNFKHDSPRQGRNSNNWQSPNQRHSNNNGSISQFYHPSMLEDPWEELEREMK